MLLKTFLGQLVVDKIDPPAQELRIWRMKGEVFGRFNRWEFIWTPRKKLKQLSAEWTAKSDRTIQDIGPGDSGPRLINLFDYRDERPGSDINERLSRSGGDSPE